MGCIIVLIDEMFIYYDGFRSKLVVMFFFFKYEIVV